MQSPSHQRDRNVVGRLTAAAILAVGATFYFRALWLYWDVCRAIWDNLGEYGLDGSDGRRFQALIIYSFAFWLGLAGVCFGAAQLLGSKPKERHWAAALGGALVAAAGLLFLSGLLGTYFKS
jgi:hypothetical protein